MTNQLTRPPKNAGGASSLSQLLTRWLVGPLLILIALSAAASYFIALQAANNAYDNALVDGARAIARHVQQNPDDFQRKLDEVVIDALRFDSQDKQYYQVVTPDGTSYPPTTPLPAAPPFQQDADYRIYDARTANSRLRIVLVPVRMHGRIGTIQVAETVVKRDRLALELLFASTLPGLLVAAAASFLFWFGIRRGLSPLDKLRGEIEIRSSGDLGPVSELGKPEEVKPLVRALNRLLAKLEESIANQQRFVANAAHQLRTPIAGLKTHSELALRQPASVELRNLLEFLYMETARTAHLINRLLALSRAESSGDNESTAVNLRETVSDAVAEWVPAAVAKEVDLGFELDDAWTAGEPLLIRELLSNLLDNAIAYTPRLGHITVRTRTTSAGALLEVEDSGPGIPQNERGKIFERFYRIPGSPGSGCGLGLSIVREIAQGHRAQVEIRDRATGIGSIFLVTFPKSR